MKARVRAGAASINCATSGTGRPWASPMLRPTWRTANFWGVINHDNEEGIIRIADNKVDAGA